MWGYMPPYIICQFVNSELTSAWLLEYQTIAYTQWYLYRASWFPVSFCRHWCVHFHLNTHMKCFNFQFSFKAVLSRNCEPWFLACGGCCSSGSTEHGPVHTYTSNPLLPDVEHKIPISLLCVSWKSFSSYWHSQKDWRWNIAHLNPL